MKKELNYGKILCYMLIGIFISLAIICITLHFVYFKFSVDGVINTIITLVICTIFCFIFKIAAGGTFRVKKKNKLSRYRKKLESEMENEATKELVPKKEKLKNVLIGLGVFIACGIGYIPLFILGSNSVNKINSDGYVRATATVRYIVDEGEGMSRLAYTYEAEDGEIYTSKTNASFGGAAFKIGKTVNIYYNVGAPETIISVSNIIITFLGASFFFLGGLLAFLGISGVARSSIFAVFFGLFFLMVSSCFTTGVELASGLSFLELIGSGLAIYAMLCFGVIGLILVGIGIVETIKDIKFLRFKRQNKDEVQRVKARHLKKLKDKELQENPDEIIIKPKKEKKTKAKYYHRLNRDVIFVGFGTLVFLGVGLWMLIGLGIIPTAKNYSYNKVEAKVVSIKTYHSKEDGDLLATYNYEYFVDGKRYERESSYGQSAELVPTVGSKINIRVNPKDPTDILDAGFTNWIMIAVGILCTGAGVGLLIGSIILSRDGVKENLDE